MCKQYSFIHPDPTLKNNLMAFGFECGAGWYKLIIDCFDKIEALHDKGGFEVVQVKEKWGELTIYAWDETEEISKIIEDSSDLSTRTCEHCGQPGHMTERHGWLATLCDDCFAGKKHFTGKFNEDNSPIMENIE